MRKTIATYRALLFFAIMMMSSMIAKAQQFSVESFKILTNDVTSFVNPVRDLNGNACALIKVPVPSDFVFSTPLGIVKREDKIGEIWLYVPNGTVRLTIKHPQWGVVRDYRLPSKLESHVAYELRLSMPETENKSLAKDSEPQIKIVRDTLVVTHTDTIVRTLEKHKVPLSASVLASAAFGGCSKSLMGGIMLTAMRKHGGYAHLLSDFGKLGKTTGTCDKHGYIDDSLPYYTGRTRHSALIVTAGAIHRLSAAMNIFEGIGYGYDNAAWQLAESSDNWYVKNSYYSHSGVAFEVGMLFNVRRLSLSASVITISGSQWHGALGIGIKIGKL